MDYKELVAVAKKCPSLTYDGILEMPTQKKIVIKGKVSENPEGVKNEPVDRFDYVGRLDIPSRLMVDAIRNRFGDHHISLALLGNSDAQLVMEKIILGLSIKVKKRR